MDLFKNYDVLEKMVKSNNEDPSTLKKVFQMNTMVRFASLKSENPNLTQVQLAKKMGISKSTLYRNQVDLGMLSFYRHKVQLKTKKPVELTTDDMMNLKESDQNGRSHLTAEEEKRLDKYLAKNIAEQNAKQTKDINEN